MRHRTRWAIAAAGGVLMASGCNSSPNAPSESPANDRPIAYLCACPSGPGLYLVNPDGTGTVQLTTVSGTFSLAWSPDGTKIAYDDWEDPTAEDHQSQIYVINADGTGKHTLTHFEDGARQPAWSPDGSRILFVKQWLGIYVMDADGSEVQRLTPDDSGFYFGPSWSPDGSTIAFNKRAFDEEASGFFTQLYLMNSDGSNQRALTTDTTNFLSRPEWSPQGDRIAFEVWGGRIATIKPDGSNRIYLTDFAGSPSWSPDGQRLVFESSVIGLSSVPRSLMDRGRNNPPHLYTINRDGTGARRVTVGSSWEIRPAWAPSTASIP